MGSNPAARMFSGEMNSRVLSPWRSKLAGRSGPRLTAGHVSHCDSRQMFIFFRFACPRPFMVTTGAENLSSFVASFSSCHATKHLPLWRKTR